MNEYNYLRLRRLKKFVLPVVLFLLAGQGTLRLYAATTWQAGRASSSVGTFYWASNSALPVTSDETFNGPTSFKRGLTVSNATTLTLNTPAAVGDVLTFGAAGSSVLVLGQDLWCRSDFSFINSGHIDGGGHTMHLGGSMVMSTEAPANTAIYSPITLDSDLCIDGGGHRVAFLTSTTSGQFVIGSHTLTLKNMELILNVATPFTFSGGQLILENVNVYLSGTSVSGLNNLKIVGSVIVRGQPFSLTSSAITIDDNSILYITNGVSLTIPASGTITMNGANSMLVLDGCTLDTTAGDLSLLKGMLLLNNQVNILATGHTLTLGDGTGSNDVLTKIGGGAYVIVDGTLYHHSS